MRILHVMASCSHASGVAQVIMNYYRQIYTRVVFDFLLFWKEDDSFEEEIIQLGGRVFYTGKPSLKNLVGYIKTLSDFFETNRGIYDAVHLHELYINSIVFPLAKKNGITVRIAHSHTSKYSARKINAIRNWLLYRPINFLATSFFACSKDAGIVAFGKHKEKKGELYVVNNAIDIEKYEFSEHGREVLRQEFGLAEDFVVGHVGRLSPEKNHLFLLQVFHKLHELKPNSKLLLVGDGKQKKQIADYVKRYNLTNSVIFAGQRADIGKVLSAMDFFVLPSLFEGLGIVLIEAQCNGLPCIASSGVPAEARILSSYRTISLNENICVWVDGILKCNSRDWDACNAVTKAGYNIEIESPKLLKKYESLIEGS